MSIRTYVAPGTLADKYVSDHFLIKMNMIVVTVFLLIILSTKQIPFGIIIQQISPTNFLEIICFLNRHHDPIPSSLKVIRICFSACSKLHAPSGTFGTYNRLGTFRHNRGQIKGPF